MNKFNKISLAIGIFGFLFPLIFLVIIRNDPHPYVFYFALTLLVDFFILISGLLFGIKGYRADASRRNSKIGIITNSIVMGLIILFVIYAR